MSDTFLSLSGDACSPATLCSSPNSNTSDLDLDSATDKNAAWAGIAVVIVVVAVGAGVWFAIRRRRRSRGGHTSVETGATRFTCWRLRRPGAVSMPESQAEQGVTDELKQQRPSSSASNLKRTPTAGSHVDAPPTAKLSPQPNGHYPMVPLQLQSTDTVTSIPPESHHHSRNPRDSLASSHRSSGSLSRINMPPPGLGPPIHRPESPSTSNPPARLSSPAQT
ncbi:unnamed protein product [Rhizoctonia solani]|uniref:Uncharacterized protein n=1 Tax=Rhizoctonia solani TaxID=456999 RepID=A0A8H3HK52_9AGAM|nr:unnamed protein product [Rhizoctonia solani]